ncbi:MAG: GxxExxY protein [Spirochaetales bacterium]|nr:GxxExxY protein [Spirochaetales bacterium]
MLLYKSLTENIIGAFYDVHAQLGPGLLEKPYRNALMLALMKRGLAVTKEQQFDVCFDGMSIGKYFADIVVEDKVVLEIKAVRELDGDMMAQVINYLNISGLPVGILVNFRNATVTFRRFENRSPNYLSSLE